MGVNLKSLIGKLNDSTRSALEGAAGLCLSRTHYDIEIEHYLMKLLDSNDGDFEKIARQFGVDPSRFSAELTRSLDKLKSGNARTPSLSPTVMKMLTEAWTIGSIDFGAGQIRTGFTILALSTEEELARLMRDVSREFQKIPGEALRTEFAAIVGSSVEEAAAPVGGGPGGAPGRPGGKTPNLDQFTSNLTDRAREGKLDPVLGRDFEIRQIIDILTRRRQNNPILTGEAGVGKTAVVEGFAVRVAQGDVPPPLKNVTVRTPDLALLHAAEMLWREGLLFSLTFVGGNSWNSDQFVARIDALRNGKVIRAYTTADGLPDDFVRSLFVDSNGALWIGTRRGLTRFDKGQFTTFSKLDGLGSNLIGVILQDHRDGALWIGTLDGLTRYSHGKFENFTTENGLSSNIVTALYQGPQGTLWIATKGGGLDRLQNGKFAGISSKKIGLPDSIYAILGDHEGYLWLSSTHGIYRVSRAELNRYADGKTKHLTFSVFGASDGMGISECSRGGHPAAWRASDGAAERRLAHTRSADKAKYGSARVVHQLADR